VIEPRIFFSPSGKRGHFPAGTSVLAAARTLGVDLDSVCGGRGICGRCQVNVGEGAFSKLGIVSSAANVSAWTEAERRYTARRGALPPGTRLGCQATLCGDVVIDVPETSQVHRQVIRKSADERVVDIDPLVRLCLVQVAEPDMHDPASDFRRLSDALLRQWGVEGASATLPVLRGLQKTLRKGDWQVTVALRGASIVAIYAGLRTRLHGVAVDIGSTTIAAHLCDLATGNVLASSGLMNPQIRFGEDLMSRVSHVMMNPGGEAELTTSVRLALDHLLGAVAAEAGIARDEIVEMTIAGNPVMHHLFLGLDPTELGGAPFALALDAAYEVAACEVGLEIAPGAQVYLLPCIAGHVGADTAGVVLAEAPQTRDDMTLIVDVGTNAELVLGNRHRLLACSSPTGPAFEGGQLSCGQRAAPGAIERFRIDRETLEPRYRIIGCEMWSDEPGFAEASAATGITGICGSGIIEALGEMYLAGIILQDGTLDGRLADRTWRVREEYRTFTYVVQSGEDAGESGRGPRIAITQHDVRAIQLAKAALYAGARILMDRLGVLSVDRVVLAGAFGSHIEPVYAMVLGLIPDCVLENVIAAGNSAGAGARIALLNKASRLEIQATVQRIEKIETAIEPGFQEQFVNAMAIPHRRDPFPHLAARVALPLVADSAGDGGRRERRRQRAGQERGS
jgi:uncharacterized 2Fe-2S/4Fe-4S cluster protein (DUF4445 family)